MSYRRGVDNVAADLLSRRIDFMEGEGESLTASRSFAEYVLLPEDLFVNQGTVMSISLVEIEPGVGKPTFVAEEKDRIEIILAKHNSLLAGHPGRSKTFTLVAREYVWPGMRAMVNHYVDACAVCQQVKYNRQKPFGLLKPLPVPSRPWKDISMDFVTKLPLSDGFDSILVVVDRFSKMTHFIPCVEAIDAEGVAKLIMKNIVRLHGLPDSIVSDRGPQFVSKFWRILLDFLGVKVKLSTAAHPQTDGQTERMNQNLEQYLRCYVNYLQNDWSGLLSYAEFAINNVPNSSTGKSPFEINKGFNPRMDYLSGVGEVLVDSVDSWVNQINIIHLGIELALRQSSEKQKEFANRKRREHKFKVGKRAQVQGW